ncbi:Uncharacterised protein [Mycobacterium tuberculosis]|nr:Uncharacterised protein [Mycobacterium tuberculosis]
MLLLGFGSLIENSSPVITQPDTGSLKAWMCGLMSSTRPSPRKRHTPSLPFTICMLLLLLKATPFLSLCVNSTKARGARLLVPSTV